MEPITEKQDKFLSKLYKRLAFSEIKDINKEIIAEDYSGVYLFFSFDLVNSTSFKSQYLSEWQKVFTRFYQLIEAYLKKHYPSISLWKYIGDEVLLYLKVTEIEQLYDAASITSKIIEDVTLKLYEEVPFTKKVLFIKSTLWVAKVDFLNPQDIDNTFKQNSPKNIVFFTGSAPEWLKEQNIDFLGPDIDLGFRLGKHTQKSKILISAELAYILNRKKGEIENYQRPTKYVVNECYKIISLEQLKGIWGDRRYPIIWFSTSWDKGKFDYDEHLESQFVSNIIGKSTLQIDIIGKIFDDLGRIEELEGIIKTIENTPKDTLKPIIKYDIPQERLAEIHCAAICFDRNGKMLIAKRTMNKKRLKGLWEFGCGQLQINQSIKDCLKKNYLNDFNAELSFPNNIPVPITTYEVVIAEERRIVPGMLFLAIIENPDDIVANNHEHVSWVEEEDLIHIEPNECVDNLHNSAKQAFIKYNQLVHLDKKREVVSTYDVYNFLKFKYEPLERFLFNDTFNLLNKYLLTNQKQPISITNFQSYLSELQRMGLVNDEIIGGSHFWSIN